MVLWGTFEGVLEGSFRTIFNDYKQIFLQHQFPLAISNSSCIGLKSGLGLWPEGRESCRFLQCRIF